MKGEIAQKKIATRTASAKASLNSPGGGGGRRREASVNIIGPTQINPT